MRLKCLIALHNLYGPKLENLRADVIAGIFATVVSAKSLSLKENSLADLAINKGFILDDHTDSDSVHALAFLESLSYEVPWVPQELIWHLSKYMRLKDD